MYFETSEISYASSYVFLRLGSSISNEVKTLVVLYRSSSRSMMQVKNSAHVTCIANSMFSCSFRHSKFSRWSTYFDQRCRSARGWCTIVGQRAERASLDERTNGRARMVQPKIHPFHFANLSILLARINRLWAQRRIVRTYVRIHSSSFRLFPSISSRPLPAIGNSCIRSPLPVRF